VNVVIVDNGEGMPQVNLNKIYEPLYSTKSFGVGLGLPLVKGK
jgi:nitrogen fixation/metabolism regulation signal transduction histidine kinase